MKPYYQDDAVTIFHGDCREIAPQLGRFDLLLTDPPYGIGADAAITPALSADNTSSATSGAWCADCALNHSPCRLIEPDHQGQANRQLRRMPLA